MPQTRRQFLVTLASAALVGCARGRAVVPTEGAAAAGSSITHYPFHRDQIEAYQVPCIGVTLGDTAPGLMFLTHYETGGGLRWESTNRIRLVTRSGRVVTTRGLRRDLTHTRFVTTDPLLEQPLVGTIACTREIDFVPGDHRAVRYESKLVPDGEEFLTILERTYHTHRIRETLEVDRWSWKAENRYWVDANGTVIRSIQRLAPDCPVVTIDLLRPVT